MNLYLLLFRIAGLVLGKQGRVSNSQLTALLGYEGEAPTMPEELSLWVEVGSAKKQREFKKILIKTNSC